MFLDWIETGTFASHTPRPAAPEELRVVSWNIARGSQIQGVSQFLVGADADLILLQESDLNARRTARRNIAKELAQRLQMHYVFGIEFQELGQGSRASPAYHGQATLSRWPLSEPRIIRFCKQSTYWHPRWWIPPLPICQRRLGGRMALVNEVDIGDRKLIVYNLHLESRNGDELRAQQLAEVLSDSLRYSLDVVVLAAGDFNFDVAGTRGRFALQADFNNPFRTLGVPTTVPSVFGRRRAIDWILFRGGVVAHFPQVHNSVRASDHYPLSLALHLP